jgi:hypothetical protein
LPAASTLVPRPNNNSVTGAPYACFPYPVAGVQPGVWQALTTIAGGEIVSADQF